jgi:hypothetical protein
MLRERNKMKINDVKLHRKHKSTGKVVSPSVNKMGNKVKEEDAEKSRDPSDAINKFLKNKKPAARR